VGTVVAISGYKSKLNINRTVIPLQINGLSRLKTTHLRNKFYFQTANGVSKICTLFYVKSEAGYVQASHCN
jgi:hypothetical protein